MKEEKNPITRNNLGKYFFGMLEHIDDVYSAVDTMDGLNRQRVKTDNSLRELDKNHKEYTTKKRKKFQKSKEFLRRRSIHFDLQWSQ